MKVIYLYGMVKRRMGRNKGCALPIKKSDPILRPMVYWQRMQKALPEREENRVEEQQLRKLPFLFKWPEYPRSF